MSIFDKVKEPRPMKFTAGDKKIKCPHCGCEDFFILNEVLLNTPGMTFMGLDWANKKADVLVCSNCSRLEWYLNTPNPITE